MTRRKDGRWVKKVTLPDGTQKYFYSSSKSEREAIKDFNMQIITYEQKAEIGKTFGEVAEEYQRTAKYNELSPTTQRRYDILIRQANSYFKNKPIKQITTSDIENALCDKAAQLYSQKTIRHQFSMYRIIFKYAKAKKYIINDETEFVTVPTGIKQQKRRALTEIEVKIVNNNIDKTFGLFAYFLLYTGLRKGEALALRYKDIDREKKLIHITKSVYFINRVPNIKTPKTEAGIRDVILLDRVADILPEGKPNDYIFPYVGDSTRLMSDDMFCRLWKKYIQETGMTGVTAHMFRHTYATILFEAGVEVKDAQTLMGHADISTTNNIYTHIRESRLSVTADKLNTYANNA